MASLHARELSNQSSGDSKGGKDTKESLTSEVREYKRAACAPRSRVRVKMSSTCEYEVPFVSQLIMAIHGTTVGG